MFSLRNKKIQFQIRYPAPHYSEFCCGAYYHVFIFQVYPTTIRTLGIGTASSWARVGAMITPFLAQVSKKTQ